MEAWLYSLVNQFAVYVPRVFSAAILLVVALIVASIARWIVGRVLTAARVDQRYGQHVGYGPDGKPFSLAKTVGTVVFWITILLFLPPILDVLALPGLFAPVQVMITRIFNFLPNLFAAAVIFAVGWLVARISQRVVSGLLAAAGTDRFSQRIGIHRALGSQTLSGLLGMIVYFLILIPVLIAALDALGIEAITRPASTMLNAILTALPNIFAAFVMLAIAYVVGRVIAQLVTDLLTAAGFNLIVNRLGFAGQAVNDKMQGQRPPAQIVGTLTLVAIMLFTAIEAMRLLGFMTLATMLAGLLTLAGQILLGLIVFGVGLYLANLAYNLIVSNGSGQSELLAWAARISILVLAGAMALQQMGIADQIVNLAFGLTLGAIAVAVALAFGLGGRETAARLLEGWHQQVEATNGQPQGDA